MSTDLIIEHLDLWTNAVIYNNGKGRGNKAVGRKGDSRKISVSFWSYTC